MIDLRLGDCLEVLRTFPDGSVDAIVTDPPAGIGFMGKEWDKDKGGRDNWIAWMRDIAAECLRVLKPGGHALVWAIPRTSHWTATAWEDAGFEIRDRVAHVFGSGFPKSLDVSKAIDKAAGVEREVVGEKVRGDVEKAKSSGVTMAAADANRNNKAIFGYGVEKITAPATDAARQWQGWGTALKPAMEDWWLCRKPLIGTVAENVLAHGTGAINVEGCRIAGVKPLMKTIDSNERNNPILHTKSATGTGETTTQGRWPSHLIHDGSDEVVGLFPADKQGSASRFFYAPKASKRDRDEGNTHPTVKATELMRYLCRLITPPGGTVLDPFMGSGSTGKAAVLEGFSFIGIEREAEYIEIARARIAAVESRTEQLELL